MNTKGVITIVSSLSLVVMLIVTAISVAIFKDMKFYQNEFEKYNVTQYIDMEMQDIMYVINELMDYLHDDRDDLENIITEVDGCSRDFFTEREKIHMADCKKFFNIGYDIRTISLITFVISICFLIITKKLNINDIIKSAGAISSIIILLIIGIGIFALIDFNYCFILFHKLAFSNDLWLLDPSEDLIINILVEPFFADMVLKIAIYCIIVLVILMVLGFGIYLKDKKRRKI